MITSDKWGCRELIAALKAYGVRHVVTSPGSRNAPLLITAARTPELHVTSVIDERSAAFIALGMATISGEPVALICTSGTALLNYAPAVAEAYYRETPLIVVSADRPAEWIGQNDSQTMRQPNTLSAFVKQSITINGDAISDTEQWFINRSLNDVLTCALRGRRGPIHINITLTQPLTNQVEVELHTFHKIDLFEHPNVITTAQSRAIAEELHSKRVLIFAGIGAPTAQLNRAISTLATMPNVAVIAEGLSNLHSEGVIWNIDPIFSNLQLTDYGHTKAAELKPDLLISFGGAPVSARWKQVARSWHTEHWHVGIADNAIDTYQSLTRRIDFSPEAFFPRVANALCFREKTQPNGSNYHQLWDDFATEISSARADSKHCKSNSHTNREWNGLNAVATVLQRTPANWNLQLSNGMTVRYALLNDLRRHHRVDCNRGVSGIDGSVSTAVGASTLYKNITLLITGDTSAQYDLAALTTTILTERFRMVVLNNGGGGIFNYIATTSKLPERDQLFKGELNLPLQQLAETFSMFYAKATDFASLNQGLQLLRADLDRPMILEIVTDADIDAEAMKRILNE
jgi:2-succinyl-5-enolpyruvyl-6-hydroxy-3-cyclohexene-1-carboxylate synthase